jgi:hypothetical protein
MTPRRIPPTRAHKGTTRARLANQQLVHPRFVKAEDLVAWFGAVQAQDYVGSLWAIGQRLPAATEADVEAAVASRAIVRTWPMRGTLHFVVAADVRWMLALLAPRLVRANAGRHRQLGLDETAFARARRILARCMSGSVPLSRRAVYEALERGGVSPAGQRGIHILWYLAQEGLICWGPRQGKQPTFVLLDDWIPTAAEPSREEALVRLAIAYFRSHGPATLADFAWWSGLLMKDARAAIDEAGDALVGETRGSATTWTWPDRRSGTARLPRASRAWLLPPWDEYLVAYKDRDAALGHLTVEPPPMVIGKALVVIDGRVRGSWMRSIASSRVAITADLWSPASPGDRRALIQAGERYGRFIGKDAEVAIRSGARRPP